MVLIPNKRRKMYVVTTLVEKGSHYVRVSYRMLLSGSSECQSLLRMCRSNDLSYLADVVTLVCLRGVCPPPPSHQSNNQATNNQCLIIPRPTPPFIHYDDSKSVSIHHLCASYERVSLKLGLRERTNLSFFRKLHKRKILLSYLHNMLFLNYKCIHWHRYK